MPILPDPTDGVAVGPDRLRDWTAALVGSVGTQDDVASDVAEILVAAAGSAGFVRGEWLRPGVVVIDVGIHRTPTGQLVGDVDFASASAVASAITPVPGGVGPMTVAMLMRNTTLAWRRNERI